MNEKEIIALLKKDDPEAMRLIFDGHHSLLCNLVYRFVKDKEVAKDIVQNVLIKFWENRHRTEITISLQAYLRKAAVNTALNYLETTNRRKPIPLDDSAATLPVSESPAQAVSAEELRNAAEKAIEALPARTRAVFILIRHEEMSYKKAAETLNISPKAVEKEMIRALKLLRGALKEFLNPSLLFLLAQAF